MFRDSIFWYVFVLGFVAVATTETFLPLRSLPSSTTRRWISNSVLLTVSSVIVGAVFKFSAVAFAVRTAGHGVLDRLPLPNAIRFVLAFALIDLTFYFSHRLFHAFSVLWRVHQVHHSETDLDLTTGLRFHPGEALITQTFLLGAVAALGAPPAAVAFIAFVDLLQDFFQHANVRLPEKLDRALRLVIVTPGVHRVHHSHAVAQQNANFGTIFTAWDRIFGTYREEKVEDGRFGLTELPDGSQLNPLRLLVLPFLSKPQSAAEDLPVPSTSEAN